MTIRKGMQNLYAVDLSKNKLSGGIPNSMCSLPCLIWLQLSDNKLSGELSLSLENCLHILSLDLGENRFSGTITKMDCRKIFFNSGITPMRQHALWKNS